MPASVCRSSTRDHGASGSPTRLARWQSGRNKAAVHGGRRAGGSHAGAATMTGAHLVLDLALAWSAAFVGGLIAQRLRQPPILGYLLAGVLLGPFTPGPVIRGGSIEVLAETGVAFLMFALGVEFSLAELRDLGPVAGIGGGV